MGHATTTIAHALADALTDQRSIVAKRFSRALKGDVEAVRRGRVASRRLREALVVATMVDAPGGVTRLRRDVRHVTRAFGPIREIDVVLEEFDRACERHEWPADRAAAVRRRFEHERERKRGELAAALAGLDRSWLRERIKTAATAIAHESHERAWWRALASHVVERVDDVTRAIAECGTLYAPERLHHVRIAIKKLRYAVEFLGDPARDEVRHAARALKRAQKKFGRLHDLQMVLARVQTIAAGGRRTALMPGFRAMVDALERDCRRIHGSLLPYLPKLHDAVLALRRDLTARLRQRGPRMAKARLVDRRADGHLRRAAR